MTAKELEKRVAALEREVAELRTERQSGLRTKDWQRTVGMFGNDEFMQRVFANALSYREQNRKAARSKAPPKRRKP